MSAVTLDTRDRISADILLTSLSYFLFTVHDAMAKLLVASIPVWQVLFFRSLTILAALPRSMAFADLPADVPALISDPHCLDMLLHRRA